MLLCHSLVKKDDKKWSLKLQAPSSKQIIVLKLTCISCFYPSVLLHLLTISDWTTWMFYSSRGWGFCLDDRPSKRDLTTPLARLGIRYTTHHQCQLQYGPNATFCQEVDVSTLPLGGDARASNYGSVHEEKTFDKTRLNPRNKLKIQS